MKTGRFSLCMECRTNNVLELKLARHCLRGDVFVRICYVFKCLIPEVRDLTLFLLNHYQNNLLLSLIKIILSGKTQTMHGLVKGTADV